MAKKLEDVIKLFTTYTGLSLDAAALAALATSGEVPDDMFSKLETHSKQLFTLESAKNSPDLEKHFKANTLLPLDTEFKRLLGELGLDDAAIAEFEAEKSTYKKPAMLAARIKTLEAAKNANPADKKALQEEITKLNNQLATNKKEHADQLKAKDDEVGNQLLNFTLQNELAGKPYVDSIPQAIRVSSSLQLINTELAKVGAKAVRTDAGIKLIRVDNPDLDYMENNKPITFGEFSDKVLSTHAMLKVSDPTKRKPGTTSHINPTPDGDGIKNQGVVDANTQAADQLEKSLGG